jgi:two-component system sensor histidine kinase BaeS
MRVPFEEQPREVEFIESTNRTLLYGALMAAIIALLLGIFLSRALTRPIRELTRATHAISEGDLSQQVPVRTNDELGELAQAFNKMSNELSRSVNTRKQMTADIAHELRTPLSLILGHAEAVHDGVLPPTRENFEIIREEATRLEHLVNDLRTLSLADAGELSTTLQTIEPGRLVQEVASLYQYQTQRKNITLELDIATPLPTIEVDPGRMTQVLTNILDNATRHTPEGGRIILSAKQTGESVEFAVQDSGPGVPAESLDRIFERFYRTDSSRQREDGGSGLGLAIAKSIVQAHNGQVSAESEAEKGLKIIIRLPKKKD